MTTPNITPVATKVEAAEIASMKEFHAAWEESISRQAPKYSEAAHD